MSSGSPRRFPSHHQAQELERFWSDPAILAWLSKPHEVVSSYDVPDLCGYSTDGKRLYVDRHLAQAKPRVAAVPYSTWIPVLIGIDVPHHRAGHEPAEKAAIDVWGYSYPAAHEDIANPNEHEYAKALGIDWAAENNALKPWIKRTELERIEKPPLDLDCRPYFEDPDANDIKILRHLQKLGVKDAQHVPHKFHPSHLGAKQAKDGEWYLPDHGRPGKYLMVKH